MSVKIDSGFSPTVPLTHSRIGMDTITRTGTVTASSTETGYSANAPANPLTYEYWKPATMAATWAVDAGEEVTIDYCGIAAHTLGTNGNTVIVMCADDSDFTSNVQVIDSVAPSDNSPIMFLFAPTTARYWRIFISGSNKPTIGVVNFGQVIEMQRTAFAGINPIEMNRVTVVRPNKSETGQWLGRSVIRQSVKTKVDFNNLTYDWYKTNMDPFAVNAQKYPFFFAWRPDGYPDSVGYVWVNQDIAPTTNGKRDLVNVSLDMEGLYIE